MELIIGEPLPRFMALLFGGYCNQCNFHHKLPTAPGIRFVATARRVTAVDNSAAVTVTGNGDMFRPAKRRFEEAARPGFQAIKE